MSMWKNLRFIKCGCNSRYDTARTVFSRRDDTKDINYQDEDMHSTSSGASNCALDEDSTTITATSSSETQRNSMEDLTVLVKNERERSKDDLKHNDEIHRSESWSRFRRTLGNRGGDVISAWGFLSSSTSSLLTDQRSWKPTLDAIRNFFETTGIDEELSETMNARLFDHMIILSRIQRLLLQGTDRRQLAADASWLAGPKNSKSTYQYSSSEAEETLRYMRYATAVYGEAMIQATRLNEKLGAVPSSSLSTSESSSFTTLSSSRRGKKGNTNSMWSRKRVSKHIGIPERDIILEATSFHGDCDSLKHMVAVDHKHRKVILAIRGTFNLAEIVADVAAFTRPFCAGEAHSEMSLMAERVWESAGETVMDLLHENEDYELILTGHSLGAGAACLLNILFHFDDRQMIDGRKVRCYAFAPPPCFKPLEFCPQAMQACTTLIHENDFVPFISVDSVRQLLSNLRALEDLQLTWRDRLQLMTGIKQPHTSMLRTVQQSRQQPLQAKAGAPRLAIPSSKIIWLREDADTGYYDAVRCDPSRLARLGVLLDANMLTDHMAGRYELALLNLGIEKKP